MEKKKKRKASYVRRGIQKRSRKKRKVGNKKEGHDKNEMIDDWNDDNESIQVFTTIIMLEFFNFFLVLKELLKLKEKLNLFFETYEKFKKKMKWISKKDSLWSLNFIIFTRFRVKIDSFFDFIFLWFKNHRNIFVFLYESSELFYIWYQKSFLIFNFRYDIKMEERKNIYSCYYL